MASQGDIKEELQGEVTIGEIGDALTTRLSNELAEILLSASRREITGPQFTELSKGLIRIALADYGVAIMEIIKRKMLPN